MAFLVSLCCWTVVEVILGVLEGILGALEQVLVVSWVVEDIVGVLGVVLWELDKIQWEHEGSAIRFVVLQGWWRQWMPIYFEYFVLFKHT